VGRAYLDHPGPIPFAHRGGAKLWPENTLEAFRGALAAGYRWIETDIHATADGTLVVLHDATLDRTTDATGPVAAWSHGALQRADAGYWFSPDGGRSRPFRGRGVRIPTLAEAFALHPDLRLNVEIKSRRPDVPRRLWDLIEAERLHDRILVAAEHTPTIRRFRELARGRVATSAGRAEAVAFFAASRVRGEALVPVAYDALQVPERERVRVVDPRFVAAAHRRGIVVHVWTVDEPAPIRRLLDLGVDGIMTDRPDHLAEILPTRR
jgi:glycerophosphoryl diester phosphodiesterase